MADFDPAAVAIRPAATVMLVRDVSSAGAGGDIEVFMMRRTTKAAFAGGMYVFPGGAVDPADGADDAARLCDGITDVEASRQLGIDTGGLAYWIAAIRECFEEAGVLLARIDGGSTIRFDDPAVAARFSSFRRQVHSGDLGIVSLCRDEGLRLEADGIFYVSNWITPFGEPRRFDTRFFVTSAPVDQEPLHDDHETVDSLWVRPREALERVQSRELLMLPPTVASLAFLASHRSVESVLRAAGTIDSPPPILPKIKFENGRMTAVLMPGDAGYDDYETGDGFVPHPR